MGYYSYIKLHFRASVSATILQIPSPPGCPDAHGRLWPAAPQYYTALWVKCFLVVYYSYYFCFSHKHNHLHKSTRFDCFFLADRTVDLLQWGAFLVRTRERHGEVILSFALLPNNSMVTVHTRHAHVLHQLAACIPHFHTPRTLLLPLSFSLFAFRYYAQDDLISPHLLLPILFYHHCSHMLACLDIAHILHTSPQNTVFSFSYISASYTLAPGLPVCIAAITTHSFAACSLHELPYARIQPKKTRIDSNQKKRTGHWQGKRK